MAHLGEQQSLARGTSRCEFAASEGWPCLFGAAAHPPSGVWQEAAAASWLLLALSLTLCLSLYFSLLWKFLSVWLGVCLADHIASEGASFVAWFWQRWAVSWDVIKTLRTGCLLHRKGMLDVAGIWGCQFGQGWKLRARDSDLFFHL